MKSGFWQVQIREEDRYKTAFTVPFGHYEWNVMPFGLKNAPSEFQNIMNDIFNPHFQFIIVYIDDVLVFSDSLEKHFIHLKKFFNVIKANGMACSAPKMKLFQTKIRFLGHEIFQGKTKPIQRSIEFADKFPDEIKDKKKLQRFLGCLNYVSDYFKDLRIICEPLYKRLRKNTPAWIEHHTSLVKEIKQRVKRLPCISIPHPNALLIIESDASNLGYGGILKQEYNNQVHIVRYHSGIWLGAQINYSTVKKEVLSIVLCISKF